MKVLNLTLPTPAENLACDEALLDAAEAGQSGEALRFWESPEYFVVVGYANKVTTEVNVTACETKGIPILRRCSGGGTVIQGPGCLSYALVLRIDEAGSTHSISAANRFIMERNRVAIQSAIGHRPSAISVRGHTDLAIGDLKFSGNSQRRRKNFLLFHGTFLLGFDLPLVTELLNLPALQPVYRAGRGHGEFITNLSLEMQEVEAALCEAWGVSESVTGFQREPLAALVARKYARPEWNLKF